MGKRSSFERIAKDFYPTFDKRAVRALVPFLPERCRFVEPCAGDGSLIRNLEEEGFHCVLALDVEPRDPLVRQGSVFDLGGIVTPFDAIITNPPWTRSILHPMICKLQRLGPTFLLFDADWAHTKQSAPFIDSCALIISVGRLRWIPGTKTDGKDNAAWYCFSAQHSGGPRFMGRAVD